jgi:formyltetrahydrofolate synthetase
MTKQQKIFASGSVNTQEQVEDLQAGKQARIHNLQKMTDPVVLAMQSNIQKSDSNAEKLNGIAAKTNELVANAEEFNKFQQGANQS